MAGVVAGVTPSGLPSQTQSANAHSYQIILLLGDKGTG